MTIQRLKNWPYPRKVSTIPDIEAHLRSLYRALTEESSERVADFKAVQLPDMPWIDIRSYGAVVNGTSDDTTAVQAAIDSLTNGGTALFPVGTCLVGKLTLNSKIRLLGMGWGSIIKLKNATNDNLLYATGENSISVENLTLDGNKANQTNLRSCVRFESCTNCDVEDCYVHDASYAGITYVSSIGMWVSDCLMEDNAYIGIFLSATTRSIVTENYITNDVGGASGYHGIMLYNGANFNTVGQNIINPTGRIIGIDVYNSHYNSVSDNICYRCENGIACGTGASYNMIQGNYCDNAQYRTTDEAGIEINAGTYNIVSDNVCNNNKMSGIYALGSSHHNTISGNACSYNAGAGVNVQSSDYCIANDNRCAFNNGRGIRVYESDFSSYGGNVCMNNGQNGAYAGIELDDCTYSLISDNICSDDQATKTQTYGIEEKATSDYNLVHDNNVVGNLTDGLVIVGTHTVDTDNLEP